MHVTSAAVRRTMWSLSASTLDDAGQRQGRRRTRERNVIYITRCIVAFTVCLFSLTVAAEDAKMSPLDLLLEQNRDRYGIVGQALIVSHDGQVVYCGVDGIADLASGAAVSGKHVFPVYSLSKLLVSALTMQLVEQRKVDVLLPASRYIPSLPPAWRNITVEQFLDHTSGVPEYFTTEEGRVVLPPGGFPADADKLFASLADVPLQFPAGTRTAYTQTNYVVLAALLSVHYKMPYARIAEQRVFTRLGMRDSFLGRPNKGARNVVTSYIGHGGHIEREQDVVWPDYAYGHAGLHLTLDDLHRLAQAMVSGELVQRRTLDRMWQPAAHPDGTPGWFSGGWESGDIDGYRVVGHDGGAHVRLRILFRGVPGTDTWIFAYLTNGSVRNVWSRVLVDSAMATVAPRRFPTATLSEGLIARATLQPFPRAVDWAEDVRTHSSLEGDALLRTVKRTAESVRENMGIVPAIRISTLNTVLFPDSAETWQDLSQACASAGSAPDAGEACRKSYEIERTVRPATPVKTETP